MLALIGYYWVWLLVAFLIGLATAWWVWGSGGTAMDELIVWPEEGLRSSGALVTIVTSANTETEISVPQEAGQEAEAPMLLVTRLLAEVDTAAPSAAPSAEHEPSPPIEVIPAQPPAPDAPDDLTIINGIGPQLNTLLGSLGITRFDQIASWNAEDIERIDSHLGVFRGRIIRDEWPEQARLLAAGDMATFWERYGEQ